MLQHGRVPHILVNLNLTQPSSFKTLAEYQTLFNHVLRLFAISFYSQLTYLAA